MNPGGGTAGSASAGEGNVGGATAGSPSGGGGGAEPTAGNGAGGSGPTPTRTFVYVATGDWGKSGAGRVRVYSLDEDSLELDAVHDVASGSLPSYLTLHPEGTALYAGDEQEGVVRAYTVDRTSGRLTELNSRTAAGKPVYLSVDKTGKFVLAAYYEQGMVETFGLESNRGIGESIQTLATGSQAHSIVLSPDNAFVFVPNKGSNNISQLRFDAGMGRLSANTPPTLEAQGGPRHLTFHPSKAFAYVMHENSSTLRAYTYDADQGLLTEIDSKSTLPASSSGNSTGADVRVEPSGKFVYASNRNGNDSTLAIFSIDAETGKLTSIGHESTRGSTPRNFGIHPNGGVLLVANQDSNNVAAFRIDSTTGELTFVATKDVGDKAWCVAFLVVPE